MKKQRNKQNNNKRWNPVGRNFEEHQYWINVSRHAKYNKESNVLEVKEHLEQRFDNTFGNIVKLANEIIIEKELKMKLIKVNPHNIDCCLKACILTLCRFCDLPKIDQICESCYHGYHDTCSESWNTTMPENHVCVTCEGNGYGI